MSDPAISEIPGDRRYSTEHVWAMELDGEVVCGITDFAQDQLGEVVYVGLPAAGTHLAAGESFGTVESMKSANELYMPVSGEVTAINALLEENPDMVNTAPYTGGWLIRVRPDGAEAVETLLADAAYRSFLASLENEA